MTQTFRSDRSLCPHCGFLPVARHGSPREEGLCLPCYNAAVMSGRVMGQVEAHPMLWEYLAMPPSAGRCEYLTRAGRHDLITPRDRELYQRYMRGR